MTARPTCRHPRLRLGALAAAVSLTAGACTTASAPSTTASAPTTSVVLPTETTTPVDSTATTSGDLPPCLAGDAPFVEDGSAGVLTSSSAEMAAVGGVSWRDYGGCERLIIEYQTTEGAPAVDPPTVATLLIRASGVLRLNLDETVTTSRFQEQQVDTDLVDGVFAVRTPSGATFVDIHLADAVVARVANVSGPGRTIVDLRRGGTPYGGTPTRAGNIIVVEPLLGDVSYPFSVSGYALTDDDEITATLVGGTASIEASAPISDHYDTWGSFTLLFPDGPDGPITVDLGGLRLILTARR